jgi:hypothetical protein
MTSGHPQPLDVPPSTLDWLLPHRQSVPPAVSLHDQARLHLFPSRNARSPIVCPPRNGQRLENSPPPPATIPLTRPPIFAIGNNRIDLLFLPERLR